MPPINNLQLMIFPNNPNLTGLELFRFRSLLIITWFVLLLTIFSFFVNLYVQDYRSAISNSIVFTFCLIPVLWLTYRLRLQLASCYLIAVSYTSSLLAFWLDITLNKKDMHPELMLILMAIGTIILFEMKQSIVIVVLLGVTFQAYRIIIMKFLDQPFEVGQLLNGFSVFSCLIYFNYFTQKLIRSAEEALVKKNEQLTKSIDIKDKLFGIIGHDLRSPIASLKTQLMGIHDGYITPLDFQQRTGRLMQMVDGVYLALDNLLHWSMLQRDQLLARPTTLDLTQLIESVLYLYTAELKEKNLALTTCLQPARVVADELQLQIVLRNLLHNAIKFTPAGGSIHVSTGQHDHTGWLRITDSGVGMPISRPASLPGQVIPSRGTAGEKGTGLGLELCREFMRLNQGELLIDSQMGKGTNVTIRLNNFANATDKQLFY
ncbi:sensor histidine kinase [Spirosoma linguale]|uniref:histidine kinase n=1 Tax=Spirosoma linguale (strain ATCC 33905 / DSM 74 / LMG 10896 / Claus 1) TaxID=504472 RepID=D2QU97_SPILD|nr:histidine kinase [Spirosoma linguale DSM 74]